MKHRKFGRDTCSHEGVLSSTVAVYCFRECMTVTSVMVLFDFFCCSVTVHTLEGCNDNAKTQPPHTSAQHTHTHMLFFILHQLIYQEYVLCYRGSPHTTEPHSGTPHCLHGLSLPTSFYTLSLGNSSSSFLTSSPAILSSPSSGTTVSQKAQQESHHYCGC